MTTGPRPRVWANDWSALDAPEPGAYEPTLAVSMVIPAYRAHDTLPYTLAALEAQSYPGHLLEVVVVDDGDGDQPLVLPEVRPEHTRVVHASDSWGRAGACHTGAEAAGGDVIHWLDADMVPSRHEVAHHMRWHHTLDHAVVLGHKLFVDDADMPSLTKLHEVARDDRLADLFVGRWVDEHAWVEEIWRRTDDLRAAGFRAFHVHVGSTASVSSDLYLAAGGLDTALKLGEDIELGYRLAMRGAVFVGEREATSWHLGRSHLMRYEEQVQRYNAPFVAQRVPDFRKFRQNQGRTYRVPYIEVVVDVAGHAWEEVKFTVDGVLNAQPADLRCRLVGPWSSLDGGRRTLFDDSQLDLRLVQEEYSTDPRVSLVEEVAPTAFPAQFRLHLPVGWRPGATSLDRLTKTMQRRSQGLRSVMLSDGQVARIERTAAVSRAFRVREEGEPLDDALDTVAESWWSEGAGDGFQHHTSVAESQDQASDQAPLTAVGGTHRPARQRLLRALGGR